MENKKLTWRDALKRLKGNFQETDYANAERQMKERYPGNYIVEEYYNSAIHNWDLRLKFNTPEDETWFLLRNE